MGVQAIATRTTESLGVTKRNARAVANERVQVSAEEYNRLADFVIELQGAVGTSESPAPGSLEARVLEALAAAAAAQEAADEALEQSEAATLTADFGTYYSPVAAYLMSGADRVTDRSGNGHTLTPSGTPVPAASHVAGVDATRFDAGFSLTCSDAALNLTGAWSCECVANPDPTTGSAGRMAAWSGSGELETGNVTWSLGASNTANRLGGGGGSGALEWETGAGTDVASAVNAYVQPYVWIHILHTRSAAGRFRTYLNGVLVYEVTGLTMPTGGSAGLMRIGGAVAGGTVKPFVGAYLALYDEELTAEEALDLARKRLALPQAAA